MQVTKQWLETLAEVVKETERMLLKTSKYYLHIQEVNEDFVTTSQWNTYNFTIIHRPNSMSWQSNNAYD